MIQRYELEARLYRAMGDRKLRGTKKRPAGRSPASAQYAEASASEKFQKTKGAFALHAPHWRKSFALCVKALARHLQNTYS